MFFQRLHAAMHRVDAYLASWRGDDDFAQDCICRAIAIENNIKWGIK